MDSENSHCLRRRITIPAGSIDDLLKGPDMTILQEMYEFRPVADTLPSGSFWIHIVPYYAEPADNDIPTIQELLAFARKYHPRRPMAPLEAVRILTSGHPEIFAYLQSQSPLYYVTALGTLETTSGGRTLLVGSERKHHTRFAVEVFGANERPSAVGRFWIALLSRQRPRPKTRSVSGRRTRRSS